MKKQHFLALIFLFTFSWAIRAQDQEHWVATWGTSPLTALESLPDWVVPPPADAMPADPPPSPVLPYPAEIADQTVRMIIRTSVGGSAIRLQLTNAQGLAPVLVEAVHVALHTSGSAIDPTTDHALTFGGKNSFTLYPGALMVSDPVSLEVDALQELAVSMYLPEPSDTRAVHEVGLNTTYIAGGNAVSAQSLPDAQTNRSYFWLSGLEVRAPQSVATIVAFGDSITDGYSTTADTHHAWPALLAARLQQNADTDHLGIINAGISGNRVLRNVIGSSALIRFDREVLARSGAQWMILLEGINDITFTALPGAPESQQASAEQIIDGLSQLTDRAHAHGIRVMGATLTPMAGLWLFNEHTETMRQTVNTWIRSSGKFDAVVDFDAVTRDPQQPSRLRPEFDSGDHIHPNDAGNAAMAAAIDLTLFLRDK